MKFIYVLILITSLFIFALSFSIPSKAEITQAKSNIISITDDIEEEQKQVDEDLYHGDEKQNLQYDEQQNEFINNSEEDEINSELIQEKEDLEYKEQTEEEIDAIEEEINEQP